MNGDVFRHIMKLCMAACVRERSGGKHERVL